MQHLAEAYSKVPERSLRPHPTEAPSHISKMPEIACYPYELEDTAAGVHL